MNHTFRREITAVCSGLLTATALLTLSACSGDELDKTSGLMDEVKVIKSVKSVPARTVPTTKVVTDDPGKPGKSAVYCVELDDVNGKPDSDDRWFVVPEGVYRDHADKGEGAKVVDMEYLRETPRCSR